MPPCPTRHSAPSSGPTVRCCATPGCSARVGRLKRARPDRGTDSAAPAATVGDGRRSTGFLWLAGDHHIHTQYSSDGKYRVVDQVRQGARHGMDWLVITDHGSTTHAKIGVEKVNPHIKEARTAHEDTLVFQGLEWSIPFVHPGQNEVPFSTTPRRNAGPIGRGRCALPTWSSSGRSGVTAGAPPRPASRARRSSGRR
ncbi:PHP domain-containing protein [Streptomyces sp. NPDC005329]|uniref:PHP domain-containing protein n=1 Tax=Streptomyces sp. NPDC005329 TaxID=3157034 RepID=UPI0033B174FA